MSNDFSSAIGPLRSQPDHPTPWWATKKADGTAFVLDARNVTVIGRIAEFRTAEAIVHTVNAIYGNITEEKP